MIPLYSLLETIEDILEVRSIFLSVGRHDRYALSGAEEQNMGRAHISCPHHTVTRISSIAYPKSGEDKEMDPRIPWVIV